jgi:nicotinamidase-related amidase
MALAASPAAVAAGEPDRDPRVLLIIDVQLFYFEDGSMPLVGAGSASRTALAVLERFRALGWPVIHVQHLPQDRDRPGQVVEPASYRIHPTLAPLPGETIVGKHHANAFRDTTLLEHLKRTGSQRLVLLGMQTHMCVEAAARAAADHGFEVTLVHDACATRDLEFADTTVPAAQVHLSTLAALDRTYARVVSCQQLLAELPEADSPAAAQ